MSVVTRSLESEVSVQTVVDVPGQQSCVAEFFVALGTGEGLGWLLLWLRLRSVKDSLRETPARRTPHLVLTVAGIMSLY